MEILVANLLFWTVWYVVSSIPFFLAQHAIDNYEKVNEWKRLLY